MEKVVILGIEEFAQVAHFYLTHDSPYEVVAFTVDEKYLSKEELFSLPIVPFENIEDKYSPDKFKMFVAIGASNVQYAQYLH